MLVTPLSDFRLSIALVAVSSLSNLSFHNFLETRCYFQIYTSVFGRQIDVRTYCPTEDADATSKLEYVHPDVPESDWIPG